MGILGTIQRYLRVGLPALRPDRLAQRLLPAVPGPRGAPDWASWIRQDQTLWDEACRRAQSGPRVLLATNVGGFAAGSVMESLLAVALTLRGARAEFLLCDGVLPACFQAVEHKVPDAGVLERYELPQTLCKTCYCPGAELYAATGLKTWTYGELVTPADRELARQLAATTPYEDVPGARWDGLEAGEHALAGALRYYARGQLPSGPEAEMVLRRFFEAAILTGLATKELFRRQRPDAACFHHGIYVPQGMTASACRQLGVPLVTWNVAYRTSCFVFSHDDTYHHTLLDEPTALWEDLPWGPEYERDVLEYLHSRLAGTRDWIWFHESPKEDVEAIARECGVDFTKPVIGLLTNVFWDAQLHYRANAFPDMLTWVLQTIAYFAGRPDLQLLIRVHPAEVRGTIPSKQPLVAEIHKAFPRLPANVFLIPPQSNSSTYAAMYRCDSVLVYGTKMGVELTAVGIPVVVAGEAWIRNKGVTRDARTHKEYFAILDALPAGRRLEGAVLERARKYAYHYFFRRMIPLTFLRPARVPAYYQVDVAGLRDLLPGQHAGLDVVCDGILHRRPFVYPAERLGAPAHQEASS